MSRFDDVPRELLIEMLKFASSNTLELRMCYHISRPHYVGGVVTTDYTIQFDVYTGIKCYAVSLSFWSKSELLKFLTRAICLQFDPKCICQAKNDAFLIDRGKYSFVFPLNRYRETIIAQFEHIAKEVAQE